MRPFRRLVMPLDCCVLGRLLGDTVASWLLKIVMTMQTANDAASQGPRAPKPQADSCRRESPTYCRPYTPLQASSAIGWIVPAP